MNDQAKRWPYVILRHCFASGQKTARIAVDHTDWMFDNGISLWTWSSDNKLPNLDQSFSERGFAKLTDHRRAYLDYEGPVSNDRGHVTRIEQGHYELIAHTVERFEVKLSGGRSGVLVLQRTLESPDAPGSDWKGAFRPTRVEAS